MAGGRAFAPFLSVFARSFSAVQFDSVNIDFHALRPLSELCASEEETAQLYGFASCCQLFWADVL